MEQDPTKISVIIRCFNEEQHIGKLLAGIQQQTEERVETILVDSGSTDATLSIARQFPVRILSIAPEEFSFGRALNMGCEAAQGTYLVFASAHVYPTYDDWLEKITQPFQNPEVALCYGKQRGNRTTKYSEHQIFKRWFPDQSDYNQKTPFCNNANCAIRKALWQEQPYDEDITGLEDLDWARKMVDKGYKVAYSADAEIIHVHDERPRQTMMRYYREALAMKQMFPEEKFSFTHFLTLWMSNTFHDYRSALSERTLLKNLVSIPQFRLMQFWGTYRGYNRLEKVTDKLRRRFYYPPEERKTEQKRRAERESRKIEYDNLLI